MATRTTRRTTSSSTRSRAKKPTTAQTVARSFRLPPHVARSLIGLLFLVLGAITVIALLFPQAGLLNRYVDDMLRPAFGQGAWLLAGTADRRRHRHRAPAGSRATARR